jgi:carboxyl-terminal processing protease
LSKKFLSVVIVLQALILISAVLINHTMGKSSSDNKTHINDEFGLLNNTMKYIKEYYRDKDDIKDDKLIYGAVKGMVESLGDPYSQFLPPDLYNDMMDDTSGKFGGLGIEIGMTGNEGKEQLTVISVFEGNPAFKAGMKSGDYITEINGKPTIGLSLYDAKRQLRGEPGTKLKLKIEREHEDEPLEFEIIRDVIQISTVKHKILNNSIAYIRVTQFSDTTPKDFDRALKEIKNTNVKGIIMDLRSNPGGTLNASVDVASSFLGENQIVVSTKSNIQGEDKEFRTNKNVLHTDLPLIVLIDRWSASGSEIVVGAIKDHKRGLIISANESTYGKGSVQTIFPMIDGKSGLKLTVAHYYTPSGKDINKVGIAPDIKRPNLTQEEIKMFRKLTSSNYIEQFIKETGDDVLIKLDKSDNNNEKNSFDKLLKKLNEENIRLNEEYIKFAIAEKTKNEIDDYEYDPLIRFASKELRNNSLSVKQ